MTRVIIVLCALLALVLLATSCTATPAVNPQATATAPTQATTVPPSPTTASQAAAQPGTAQNSSLQYPAPPNGIPADLPSAGPLGSYVAFAWNNLGMHCDQADYSQFLILPPYNVFWTQVIARGRRPSIVKSGLTATYNVPSVTNPAAHSDFWRMAPTYGFNLQPGIGLKGKGTAGAMDLVGDHFIAEGVPVVDINDQGIWDPYPFFVVTLKDNAGKQVAQTVNVAPVSTEMSCYLCHGGSTPQESMANILQAHDRSSKTDLYNQAKAGKPAACYSCHADPAMGVSANNGAKASESSAMHTFHADKLTGSNLPANTCQACHPGPQTQCLRDVMATNGVTCTDCHGTMADVGSPQRTAWVNLPQCESCHTTSLTKATAKTIANPNQKLTANEASLYRNRKAHGGGGIYCAACHGSPHAVYPDQTPRDNEQSIRLQGKAGPIVTCTVCHANKPDEAFWHTGERD